MLSNDHDFFTFSMHCDSNFPLKKMTSDIDVSLKKGTNDQEYLDILGENLEKLDHIQRDIVFFQAGVDILEADGLGHLSLTRNGVTARNKMILDFAKEGHSPIVVFMGGGYSKPIKHSVNAFVDLFKQCSNF